MCAAVAVVVALDYLSPPNRPWGAPGRHFECQRLIFSMIHALYVPLGITIYLRQSLN